MARADLHNAFAIDGELYQASRVDPTLLDPVVRVDGALPGAARPFVVVREYQGPQGGYVEQFALRDASGRDLVRSQRDRIELRGEMFEDRFTTPVRGVHIAESGQHQLAFFIDGDEVGAVPVFFEGAEGGDLSVVAEETFKSAMKKSSIAWVTVALNGRGARPHTQPVWYTYDQEKVYVFTGPTEQNIPGLTSAETVELSARAKDERSLVCRATCEVEVVPKDDDRWEKAAKTSLTRRLNLPDGDAAYDRWKQHCELVELTPRFRSPEAEQAAAAAPAAAQQATPEAATGTSSDDGEDEIHVEAQVDEEKLEEFLGQGMPERVARAKAKAHYVRTEKARIREERAEA
ncbi:MAG: hypothetical protein ACR2MA_08415 [Egibacteraceae bacterium]